MARLLALTWHYNRLTPKSKVIIHISQECTLHPSPPSTTSLYLLLPCLIPIIYQHIIPTLSTPRELLIKRHASKKVTAYVCFLRWVNFGQFLYRWRMHTCWQIGGVWAKRGHDNWNSTLAFLFFYSLKRSLGSQRRFYSLWGKKKTVNSFVDNSIWPPTTWPL